MRKKMIYDILFNMKFTHLLFDLDNTLYPSSSQMDYGISKRMLECVADFFNCSEEQAAEIRKERIVHYSTTLEWLRDEGFSDVEGFLSHVHPQNEADELQVQPKLRDFLLSIPIKKSILTNAPYEHATRVLEKLGISDLFENITDIRDTQFCGKPYPNAYNCALKKANEQIETTLFLDDMQKYTDGWRALGGTAILIGEKNGRPLSKDAKSMQHAKNGLKGKLIKLPSIYELHRVLDF